MAVERSLKPIIGALRLNAVDLRAEEKRLGNKFGVGSELVRPFTARVAATEETARIIEEGLSDILQKLSARGLRDPESGELQVTFLPEKAPTANTPKPAEEVAGQLVDVRVDPESRVFIIGATKIKLTGSKEAEAMQVLKAHQGRFVLAKDLLQEITKGRKPSERELGNFYNTLMRLRNKVNPDPDHQTVLVSSRSGGYSLLPDKTALQSAGGKPALELSLQETAAKANLSPSTVKNYINWGALRVGIDYAEVRGGARKQIVVTGSGLNRLQLIRRETKGAKLRQSTVKGIVERLFSRKPKSEGEQPWQLVDPFTKQEEAVLANKLLLLPKENGKAKKLAVEFDSALLTECQRAWDEYNNQVSSGEVAALDPKEACDSIERKLRSLIAAKSLNKVRDERYAHHGNEYYSYIVAEVLRAAMPLGLEKRRQLIDAICHPVARFLGDTNLLIDKRVE
ncbi:MAG: hypothetical protein M1484_03910 [Patescibacteria group bacterium]|nr:hypothetical protein [Patescibacteria group bacterium]MCL5432207.1 hypothetical protein [Patescibacteria group bacterium]